MARTRCFLLEPTDRVARYLRRYSNDGRWDAELNRAIYERPCPLSNGTFHGAMVRVEDEPVVLDTREGYEGYITNGKEQPTEEQKADPRWPTHCACGYAFLPDDHWQIFVDRLMSRSDSGEELPLRDAPPGSMWFAQWLDRHFTPQLGHNLVVKLPDGTDWQVDSQASNCTMQDDWKQERHHCWVIRGTPPNLTVSKDGPTCAAGAGSIQSPRWHGFLRGGYLEE